MPYKVFDLLVDSEIELFDFESISGGAPAVSVKLGQGPMPVAPAAWRHVWRRGIGTPSDLAWSFAWHDQDLLLAMPKCGEFHLTDGLRSMVCYPYPRTSDWVLRKQLSYSLIPRILGELGHLVLHASCVSIEGGGSLVFVGHSGAGKSTLAASFAGDGGHLRSDDSVLLKQSAGGLVAFVTGSFARLWDDSHANLVGPSDNAVGGADAGPDAKWKHRFAPGTPIPSGASVRAIFDLSPPDSPVEPGVAISEQPGARLLSVLTERTLLLDSDSKRNRHQRFINASEVANACPAFYAISFRRRFDLLPEVRAAILHTIGVENPSDRQGIAP